MKTKLKCPICTKDRHKYTEIPHLIVAFLEDGTAQVNCGVCEYSHLYKPFGDVK